MKTSNPLNNQSQWQGFVPRPTNNKLPIHNDAMQNTANSTAAMQQTPYETSLLIQ
jgi:hypothetical protein